MSAETTPQEAAFIRSAGRKFGEIKLGPFTPRLQAIAAEMGMKWPWTEEKDLIKKQFTTTDPESGKKVKRVIYYYRQGYADSIIAIWLCAQPESRIDDAEIDPAQARKDAMAWAGEQAINQNSVAGWEAYAIWDQMIMEIQVSRATPKAKHGAPPEDGEPDAGEL